MILVGDSSQNNNDNDGDSGDDNKSLNHSKNNILDDNSYSIDEIKDVSVIDISKDKGQKKTEKK